MEKPLVLITTGHPATGKTTFAMESNFDPATANLEFLRLKEVYPVRPVQVACRTDGSALLERFRQRDLAGERHPGHVDQTAVEELINRLQGGDLDPLPIGGPVIVVDTTDLAAVDCEEVLRQVQQAIEVQGSAIP